MDDKFQLDKDGDNWLIAGSPADPALIVQSLEEQFQASKRYNETPIDMCQ
jgi:hypothetical protein